MRHLCTTLCDIYVQRCTVPPLTGSVDHCQGSVRHTLSAVLTLTTVAGVFAVSVLTLTGLATLSGLALLPVSVRYADLSGCVAADRVKKTLPPLSGRAPLSRRCIAPTCQAAL
ncbi:MAG: hypothetical protein LBL04_17900 [Bacteroidales bacterium]|nr:hypothetical protein [Bacteroidales bacterium]